MTIEIPDTAFSRPGDSPENLSLELAIFLYEKGRLTMGQARKMAKLDVVSFQKELSKRDVYIHFEIEDLEKDLRNLEMAQ